MASDDQNIFYNDSLIVQATENLKKRQERKNLVNKALTFINYTIGIMIACIGIGLLWLLISWGISLILNRDSTVIYETVSSPITNQPVMANETPQTTPNPQNQNTNRTNSFQESPNSDPVRIMDNQNQTQEINDNQEPLRQESEQNTPSSNAPQNPRQEISEAPSESQTISSTVNTFDYVTRDDGSRVTTGYTYEPPLEIDDDGNIINAQESWCYVLMANSSGVQSWVTLNNDGVDSEYEIGYQELLTNEEFISLQSECTNKFY